MSPTRGSEIAFNTLLSSAFQALPAAPIRSEPPWLDDLEAGAKALLNLPLKGLAAHAPELTAVAVIAPFAIAVLAAVQPYVAAS